MFDLHEAVRESEEWKRLSYEEKNEKLFESQKRVLDMFLERGAISRQQYDKSLRDLVAAHEQHK